MTTPTPRQPDEAQVEAVFRARVEQVLAEREQFEGAVLTGPFGDGFCQGWASAVADIHYALFLAAPQEQTP